MIITLAAMGQRREIGKNGQLLWRLPSDLKFFHRFTSIGRGMLMGSKTFESLPRILPGREHYVLTRDPKKLKELIAEKPGDKQLVHAVTDLDKFVCDWKESRPAEDLLFVIGGGMVYWETLKYVDACFISEVKAEDLDADTFFPELPEKEWERVEGDEIFEDGDEVPYRRITYYRKEIHGKRFRF
ncbi:dihydrofolate reductase [Candidatus Saccharibacteria bacterium]|nr:dihydrofolate reductase [Candidatus Saccharibacteria bacterium]